jgi:hypothetical protein
MVGNSCGANRAVHRLLFYPGSPLPAEAKHELAKPVDVQVNRPVDRMLTAPRPLLCNKPYGAHHSGPPVIASRRPGVEDRGPGWRENPTCSQQPLKSAIKMTIGSGTPKTRSRIERISHSPYTTRHLEGSALHELHMIAFPTAECRGVAGEKRASQKGDKQP